MPEPHPLVAVLAKRRRNQRRSQLDVASEIGVSQITVCHWETGHRMPTVGHLTSYADTLGCEITISPRRDL